MKVLTRNLSGAHLDWAVSIAKGQSFWTGASYSTDWAVGGPIIDRELDTVRKRSKEEEKELQYPNPNFTFKAEKWVDGRYFCAFGPTMLIACLRCYVEYKLGPEVDVPPELRS